jgi:hypothetical protein
MELLSKERLPRIVIEPRRHEVITEGIDLLVRNLDVYSSSGGPRCIVVVKALGYKSGGRVFETR